MIRRWKHVLLAAGLCALGACSGVLSAGGEIGAIATGTLRYVAAPESPGVPLPVPDPGAPASPPATTTTTTTTPARPPAPPDVHDPDCVWVIRPGDSLGLIAEELDTDGVTVESLQAENRIPHADYIDAGGLLDICVDNEINDVTGDPRTAPGSDLVDDGATTGVAAQQRKLNQLFAPFATPELLVDGISGPLTRQQLCAARLLLGLPVSRADMQPGSAEERWLMSATGLTIPSTAPTSARRWVLIDMTCQILIAGEGGHTIRFVFPTSTGEPGYETRAHARVRAFRYNPAAHNNGWHDSTLYPVESDNPLNGNMYRPIYFDNGQAIHGANNVPTYPRSKGCVRLRVHHQDALVAWLGLGGVTNQLWEPGQINLSVTTQGRY